MKQIKNPNVNKTVKNFTINDTTDSNSSTSTIQTNDNSKYSDTFYQPSTSDDNKSSSLNKKELTRGRIRNQINYIRPNFLQNLENKNNTSIASPTLEIQNLKLRQKINNTTKNVSSPVSTNILQKNFAIFKKYMIFR